MGHSLLACRRPDRARRVGRKFQRPTVFEDQSVRDNLRDGAEEDRAGRFR
jgi:ABC-type uncharacterized transport system ATPase subunit